MTEDHAADSKPAVSVVLPVRNGARFLAESLDCILHQTPPVLELLIIDGKSTDATPNIVAAFAGRDPRVRCIVQTGKGVGDAYNIGIEAAQGDYIAFASHDDNWTVDKLAVQLAYMDAHPEVDYSIGRARFFLEPGCSVPPGFRTYLLEGEHMIRGVEVMMVRRTLFARIGIFPTDYVSAADVEWLARATHMNAVLGEIDHLLLNRRIHDLNTSIQNLDNTREMLRALRTSLHLKKGSS
ncbi:MAG: glycosyltransferase [Chloroflexota bacterium]|nr:glycosyltransferase [Chloroflexota bacterium]